MQSSSSLTASSPSFPCEAFSYVYVTGWVYVGAGGGAPAGIKLETRDFADTLISTQNLMVGAVNTLPSGWLPFTCWGKQPANGSKARIQLYVESGADLEFYGIAAYIDK